MEKTNTYSSSLLVEIVLRYVTSSIIYPALVLIRLQNDKGTAAYLTVELDETLGSTSTQVRVVQDKEPAQFLAIFKGKYVVHAVC